MRTAPTPRTLGGQVGTSGGTGPDWTATRTAAGTYTVRFVRPFRGPPAVTVSPVWGVLGVIAQVSALAADQVQIITGSGSTLTDVTFVFIATGT